MLGYVQNDNELTDGWINEMLGLLNWGVSNLAIIGSDNGLLPGWHQAIIWTSDGIYFYY